MLGLYNYSELFNIENLEKMQLLKGEVHTHITGCGSQYENDFEPSLETEVLKLYGEPVV